MISVNKFKTMTDKEKTLLLLAKKYQEHFRDVSDELYDYITEIDSLSKHISELKEIKEDKLKDKDFVLDITDNKERLLTRITSEEGFTNVLKEAIEDHKNLIFDALKNIREILINNNIIEEYDYT